VGGVGRGGEVGREGLKEREGKERGDKRGREGERNLDPQCSRQIDAYAADLVTELLERPVENFESRLTIGVRLGYVNTGVVNVFGRRRHCIKAFCRRCVECRCPLALSFASFIFICVFIHVICRRQILFLRRLAVSVKSLFYSSFLVVRIYRIVVVFFALSEEFVQRTLLTYVIIRRSTNSLIVI
jgi:hypothetical protein